MTRLPRLIAQALRAATPTVEDLARRLGLSSSALRRYRLGDRVPDRRIVERLASELHRQAKVVECLAGQLDAAVQKEDHHHG